MTGEIILKIAEQETLLETISQTGSMVIQLANEKEILNLIAKTPFSTKIAFGSLIFAVLNTFFVTWIAGKRIKDEREHQFNKEEYFFKLNKAEQIIIKVNEWIKETGKAQEQSSSESNSNVGYYWNLSTSIKEEIDGIIQLYFPFLGETLFHFFNKYETEHKKAMDIMYWNHPDYSSLSAEEAAEEVNRILENINDEKIRTFTHIRESISNH